MEEPPRWPYGAEVTESSSWEILKKIGNVLRGGGYAHDSEMTYLIPAETLGEMVHVAVAFLRREPMSSPGDLAITDYKRDRITQWKDYHERRGRTDLPPVSDYDAWKPLMEPGIPSPVGDLVYQAVEIREPRNLHLLTRLYITFHFLLRRGFTIKEIIEGASLAGGQVWPWKPGSPFLGRVGISVQKVRVLLDAINRKTHIFRWTVREMMESEYERLHSLEGEYDRYFLAMLLTGKEDGVLPEYKPESVDEPQPTLPIDE